MTEEEEKLMEKSQHALKVAHELLTKDYFSDAASKAYYSMFYAAQALLKSRGIDVVKHSAVEAGFGHHFTKTGEIEPKFHKMLIDARMVRQRADYSIKDEVIGSVASKTVEEAEEFLSVIKQMFKKK